jgi:hypothetical protein
MFVKRATDVRHGRLRDRTYSRALARMDQSVGTLMTNGCPPVVNSTRIASNSVAVISFIGRLLSDGRTLR